MYALLPRTLHCIQLAKPLLNDLLSLQRSSFPPSTSQKLLLAFSQRPWRQTTKIQKDEGKCPVEHMPIAEKEKVGVQNLVDKIIAWKPPAAKIIVWEEDMEHPQRLHKISLGLCWKGLKRHMEISSRAHPATCCQLRAENTHVSLRAVVVGIHAGTGITPCWRKKEPQPSKFHRINKALATVWSKRKFHSSTNLQSYWAPIHGHLLFSCAKYDDLWCHSAKRSGSWLWLHGCALKQACGCRGRTFTATVQSHHLKPQSQHATKSFKDPKQLYEKS